MKHKGFTNIKVPEELINILLKHEEFIGTDNYKHIAPCYELLTRIHRISSIMDSEWVYYNSDSIHTIFINHGIKSYSRYLEIMVIENLLIVDGLSFPLNHIHGICNKYKLSDNCNSILSKNLVNLRAHFRDPIIKKSMNTNKRKQNSRFTKAESNPVLLYHQSLMSKLECNEDMMKDIQSNLNEKENANVDYSVLSIARGEYNNNISDKDGRLHHSFLLMKSEARKAYYINSDSKKFKYLYKYIIDIRACFPTLFSLLFSFPYSILQYERLFVTPEQKIQLNEEIVGWTAFWTQTKHDPRLLIAEEFGMPLDTEENIEKSKDKIKKQLNTAINDGKWDNKLKKWINQHYPMMYKLWMENIDIPTTGCMIAKNYETKIMLSPKLYQFAATLPDIKIINEHDGVGVFVREDVDVTNQIEILRLYIIELFWQEYNIKPVVKSEKV